MLKGRLDGIGWFTHECLKRIVTQHKEHTFYFIFDRKFDEQFIFSDNIIPIVKMPQARHPWLFYLWFEYALPSVFNKIRPDIFLSPDGFLSMKSEVKSVAVIHDLNFEHYPEHLPANITRYYRKNFPEFAKKAKRIATVSEYSKKDIAASYNISIDKIDVVFNGLNEGFRPLSKDEIVAARNKYTAGCPYFVFVGSIHPRKNIINLFKAFEIFKERHSNNFKLVLAGAKMWWTNDMETTLKQMKYKNDVVFTGRAGASELAEIVGGAFAMTYVSFFEGFGIPILESFASNVPLILSSATSLPEIAADAALYADPDSPQLIADAMSELLADKELQRSLVQRGNIRKHEFTWQKSADRLWNCLLKANS